MDPVKVIIFVAAFLLLIILGRKFSSSGESIPIPPSLPKTDDELPEEDPAPNNKPALIGADMPFPIYVPQITQDQDGKYNRPEFLNYYFEHIDLRQGPSDPTTFYDHLFLEARDLENSHTIHYKFFVASPSGLQKALAEERIPAIHLREDAFIVSRWDLAMILEAVVKYVMESYKEGFNPTAHAFPDSLE